MTKNKISKEQETLGTISSVLIANRGEIASRIIRTCKKMGIRSVAVFSEADREALFVREADFAIGIGESVPTESYLNQSKLIDICLKNQIDAIHPGYGFLSENAAFAKKCTEAGIIFIGPRSEVIDAMGSKSKAKTLMQAHGVPVIPGYQGEDQSPKKLSEEAKKIGFPLLLKAAAGGGGKGMRIVEKAETLEENIQAAQREAQNAFGDEELIIEKYIASGRHIEFQIFGDKHGNALHLSERECSIQRRYQKIIEESPSPALDEVLRAKMGEAALKAAKALQYDNAGTVEFILDEQSQEFYFLEVNTRLQVEHPVTEEITGLDLVELQIQIAEGQKIPFAQEEIQTKGYAVECRLYAEDAQNDFMPTTGKILLWQTPNIDGLRIETAVESNSEISIYYDPMIAKLIVWDSNRANAHRKMQYVLRNLLCLGLTTNQSFLRKLFENQAFREGRYNTHFLQNDFDFEQISPSTESRHAAAIACTLLQWHTRQGQRKLLKSLPSGWRNSFYQAQQESYQVEKEDTEIHLRYKFLQNQDFEFSIEAETLAVTLLQIQESSISFELNAQRFHYHFAQKNNQYYLQHEYLGSISLRHKERFPEKEVQKVVGGFEAPMPSQVIKTLVEVGQDIQAGDSLLILSSMKMENTLSAYQDGTVEEIYVSEGQSVEAGFLLLKIKPLESD